MVETKGMNSVLEIDPDNMSVTVQAGITIWELNEHLETDRGRVESAMEAAIEKVRNEGA